MEIGGDLTRYGKKNWGMGENRLTSDPQTLKLSWSTNQNVMVTPRVLT
jgi:hypothetical protein